MVGKLFKRDGKIILKASGKIYHLRYWFKPWLIEDIPKVFYRLG